MAPRLPTLALALGLAAAGCQSPGGRCDTTADCTSAERCQEGVCVPGPILGGNGSGGGTVPASFTPVLWSTCPDPSPGSFSVDAVGVGALSDDVYVTAALAGAYDPWSLTTGAFALRLDGGTGGVVWTAALPPAGPAFAHGEVRTAVAPDGGLLYAGASGGALLVGRLTPAGGPDWSLPPIPGTHATVTIAPVSAASRGGDLLLTGVGAADFGCGDTATGGSATFAARLDGATGACVWSRGFTTSQVTDLEPRDQGDVALAGVCAPVGASFDPGSGTTCAKGLFVAALDGATGATSWARFSGGAGTVTAVRDLAVAPDGSLALVGDAKGVVSFGGAAVDFGANEGSFAARFSAAGAPGAVLRPVEAPYAPLPDAASFARAAYDRNGKLWIAGRYYGQPTLATTLFPACREPACSAASFLARIEANGTVGSFLPVRIAAVGGAAFPDDLVLFATTGAVAHAQRFSGSATVGATPWSATAGLGVLRVVP
jgi:hypothetical protein